MHKVFSPKTGYWLKTLSKFVSVQIFVQALGFASGILLIRTLDKQEYAYFTLANSMQGTMNVLASTGIGSALSSIGGKVWQDPDRFGQLINTAMHLRRYLAAIVVPIVTPILIWMLLKNGASFNYALILVVGILIELYFYLNNGIWVIVPRLHSQISQLQRLDLLFAGSRLFLLLAFIPIFLNATVGVFTSTIASGLRNLSLSSLVKKTIKTNVPINKDDYQEIFKLVKAQAPIAIFYCLQGQVTIWLISIFGNPQNIAEVGALSRLGLLFSLINSVISNIFIPSFARCQSPKLLQLRYWQFLSFYGFVSVFLLILAIIFPYQLLWILGKNYAGLNHELIAMILRINISFLSGVVWAINVNKGWIKKVG